MLDAFVASKDFSGGLAALDAARLVTRNPASATATPTASKIPIADASGKLDSWITTGVTNGDAHDHNGGDGAQIDHVNLANKGTNTHAQIDSFLAEAWFDLGLSGTYVSATSFTLVGDFTAYFKIGTKFRCTNSTTKYGYVLSSSYAAPNTTINLVPNTSYSLANAAITDIKISYASPPDFPNLLAYTPTLSAQSGSFTNATVSGYFSITDRKCHVEITITIVTNGTASGITATTPVGFSSITIFAGRENQTTGIMLHGIGYNNFINIFNYAGANINADNLTIYINGEYPM
jgi:hypothetical protein